MTRLVRNDCVCATWSWPLLVCCSPFGPGNCATLVCVPGPTPAAKTMLFHQGGPRFGELPQVRWFSDPSRAQDVCGRFRWPQGMVRVAWFPKLRVPELRRERPIRRTPGRSSFGSVGALVRHRARAPGGSALRAGTSIQVDLHSLWRTAAPGAEPPSHHLPLRRLSAQPGM